MSKLVKNLLVDDLKKRLDKVEDVVVVSLGRLDAQKTTELRKTLRQKKIHLQLVKNSLARRATLDTQLAPAFEKTEGMLAIAWGGEDAVDLAKELDRLTGLKDYEGLQCRGGESVAAASLAAAAAAAALELLPVGGEAPRPERRKWMRWRLSSMARGARARSLKA